jgi:Zn-dependent peptidase ImmA (M78 family)/transcriptional regulator with XRE-family HTH domain
VIGDRVRHARLYHGWSQGKLGTLTGVGQPMISKIEKGVPPSAVTLAAIAETTEFAPWWFERGRLPDLPQGSLRYRKRATARVRDDERIRAHVRQAIEVLHAVEEQHVATIPDVRLRPVSPSQTVDNDYIEALAEECREWIGVGPNDAIPNVTRAIERAGVAVIGSSQEIEKHEGATYWPDFPSGRPIVCISRGRSGDKQRLSLGHEFGHLLLHQLRDDASDTETEAFRFAGALLIPRAAAFEAIQTPVTLRELALVKARFGISIVALVRRCLDLGIIDHDRRTSLEKQISARNWRKVEPVSVPNEEPRLLRRLVEAAFGTLQPRQLHKQFGLPPLAMRDLLS